MSVARALYRSSGTAGLLRAPRLAFSQARRATDTFRAGFASHSRRDEEESGVAGKAVTATQMVGAPLTVAAMMHAMPGSTIFAGSAAAPMVGPTMVTFLQMFPPIAAQACFLAPYSALKGVQERGDTGDLPLLPYAAMAVNGVGWIAYGVLAGEPTIWLPNITACLAGVYYWSIYAKNTKNNMMPWYGGGAVAVMAIAALANNTEPILGLESQTVLGLYLNAVVVAMFGGPLGAIKTVMATEDTSSIPLPFAVATFVNCAVWSAYGILVIHDPLVYGCNLLGLGSGIAQLACHAKYGTTKQAA